MNEIVISNNNGTLTVSSIQVAQDFEKRHDHITRDIENLIEQAKSHCSKLSGENLIEQAESHSPILGTENSAVKSMFIETTYTNERGREYKCYNMTRDGFSLLVMGFTGAKALEWKLKYIQAFNEMERQLREPKTKSVDDKAKALEIRMMNAKARLMKAQAEQSKVLLECAKISSLSDVSRNCIVAKAVELATGEQIVALPKIEKTYTATEIGDMFGVSANKIGRVAKEYNLKTAEYGEEVLDMAKYAKGKQVPTFRYNEKAIEKFKEILS